MRKLILYSMFLILLIDVMFGLGFSVARGLSIKNLFLYFLIAMIAIDAALKPGEFVFSDVDVHLPFALLIIYAVFSWSLSSAFSPVYPAFQSLIALKGGLIDHYLFFLAFRYGLRRQEDALWLIRAMVGTLLLTSVFTLIDFLNIPDLGVIGTHRGRVEGPIGAANQYGALLGFLLPLAVSLSPARGIARIAWSLGILVSALLLVATGSRGAYVSLIFGSALAVYYLRAYLDLGRVARFAGLSLLIAVVLGIAYTVLRGDVLQSIIEKTTAGDVGSVSSGRTDIWLAGLQVMAERPISYLVGLGWNAWEISGIWKSAHNVYLNHLFELGLIGLCIFVFLLHNLFRRVRGLVAACPGAPDPVFVGLTIALAVISVAIFFSPIQRVWTIVWSITGLVFALRPTAAAVDSAAAVSTAAPEARVLRKSGPSPSTGAT